MSWIRHKDTLLLAIGRYTYTSDYRFKAIHKLMSEDYLLQIRPVQVNKLTQKTPQKVIKTISFKSWVKVTYGMGLYYRFPLIPVPRVR